MTNRIVFPNEALASLLVGMFVWPFANSLFTILDPVYGKWLTQAVGAVLYGLAHLVVWVLLKHRHFYFIGAAIACVVNACGMYYFGWFSDSLAQIGFGLIFMIPAYIVTKRTGIHFKVKHVAYGVFYLVLAALLFLAR